MAQTGHGTAGQCRVRSKFLHCASAYADRAGAEQALALLERLEELPDVGAIARALTR